jgi:deoxyribonuclease V
MKAFPALHRWDLTPAEAIRLQQELAARVCLTDDFGRLETVAGIDIGFEARNTVTRAAVAVLRLDDLSFIEGCIARRQTAFPYVPGLLSFREMPAALAALEGLSALPDLLAWDGQGYAHPRRFGVACHAGVYTGLPAIGVAKSRLTGTHETPGDARGDWRPLRDGDEIIGAVLRTRPGVRPVYVSPGHRVGFDSARALALRLVTRYRLPETTRWAHRLASGDLDALPAEVRKRVSVGPLSGP